MKINLGDIIIARKTDGCKRIKLTNYESKLAMVNGRIVARGHGNPINTPRGIIKKTNGCGSRIRTHKHKYIHTCVHIFTRLASMKDKFSS